MIPIPIPTKQALIPILVPESDSDFGIIYNSGGEPIPMPAAASLCEEAEGDL